MTESSTTETDPPAPDPTLPARHRQVWEHRDFEHVIEACRDGCDLEAIAERVGRTVGSVRSQIQRLLPRDEPQIQTDLIPERLR